MLLGIIHRPVFYFKHTAFRRLDSVFVFRQNLLSWAQSIELVPIFGHLNQHHDRVQEPSTAQTICES
jgi:hypothetical protein